MKVSPSKSVKVHTATVLPESMTHLSEEGIPAPVAVMMPSCVTLKVPDTGVVDPSDPLYMTENEPSEPIAIEPLSHQE